MKQIDLKEQLDDQNLGQNICDDFVAAFLHAGLPVTKLDHKSIRGLMRKYTKVEGSVQKGASLYRSAQRVLSVHLGAIRKKVQGKKVSSLIFLPVQQLRDHSHWQVGSKLFCWNLNNTIFSGLIDAKNRQSMGASLRQAAVCLFCNGDMEERFTKA